MTMLTDWTTKDLVACGSYILCILTPQFLPHLDHKLTIRLSSYCLLYMSVCCICYLWLQRVRRVYRPLQGLQSGDIRSWLNLASKTQKKIFARVVYCSDTVTFWFYSHTKWRHCPRLDSPHNVGAVNEERKWLWQYTSQWLVILFCVKTWTKWRQLAMRIWWPAVYRLSTSVMLKKCHFLRWNFWSPSNIMSFHTCLNRIYNYALDCTLVRAALRLFLWIVQSIVGLTMGLWAYAPILLKLPSSRY